MKQIFIINSMILCFCFNLLAIHNNCHATVTTDSLHKKFKTHVLTLDYISRKTNNGKYYLNMASKYCDSLILIGRDSSWSKIFKEKIALTLKTCENNMNHMVQLFPYFNGFPPFMGFADDPIEYAYDFTLLELLNTIFFDIHDGPLSEANISSIITRGNCDDEMFEIVRQNITSNTSHYIVTREEMNEILGFEKNIIFN